MSSPLPVNEEFRNAPHTRLPANLSAQLYLPRSVRERLEEEAQAAYPDTVVGVLIGPGQVITDYHPHAGDGSAGMTRFAYLHAWYVQEHDDETRELLAGMWTAAFKEPPEVIGVYVIAEGMPPRIFNEILEGGPGLFKLYVDMSYPESPAYFATRFNVESARFEKVKVELFDD